MNTLTVSENNNSSHREDTVYEPVIRLYDPHTHPPLPQS